MLYSLKIFIAFLSIMKNFQVWYQMYDITFVKFHPFAIFIYTLNPKS